MLREGWREEVVRHPPLVALGAPSIPLIALSSADPPWARWTFVALYLAGGVALMLGAGWVLWRDSDMRRRWLIRRTEAGGRKL